MAELNQYLGFKRVDKSITPTWDEIKDGALVKTDTKEGNWKDFLIPFPPQDYPLRDGKEIKTWMDGYKQAVIDRAQPEPEESQESMINEIINLWRLGGNPEGIKSIFIIQRK